MMIYPVAHSCTSMLIHSKSFHWNVNFNPETTICILTALRSSEICFYLSEKHSLPKYTESEGGNTLTGLHYSNSPTEALQTGGKIHIKDIHDNTDMGGTGLN